MSLKEALKSNLSENNLFQKKLNQKEVSLVKSSFDIVGDIAILEIPVELKKKEKIIAEKVVELNKNIKTVCKKAGERKGVYRLRKYRLILGNSLETIHRESGCQFKLDISKAYFSVRESTERLRISSQINPKEKVLVLFSGVGPFGIIIAKNHPDCQIDMVEINPTACRYAEENIRINKVGDRITNYCGDIRKIHKNIPSFFSKKKEPKKDRNRSSDRFPTFANPERKEFTKYDRIIMPLPETAYKFLDIAVEHLKKKGIIYLYCIEGEKEKNKIENIINKKKKLKLIQKRKVLPYSPGVWKVCFELEKA